MIRLFDALAGLKEKANRLNNKSRLGLVIGQIGEGLRMKRVDKL